MQDQRRSPFPEYLRAWLERKKQSAGDLAVELGTEPETVQRMLNGTPVASQFRTKIHEVTGYDFDQTEFDAIRTALLATEQDPRVREFLELLQSWEDLRVILRSVAKRVSSDAMERTCGTAQTTLGGFLRGTQRSLREQTFMRVVRTLPLLTDIAEGNVLSRISPAPVLRRALAAKRLQHGLSKTAFAQAIGISNVSVITKWEEDPDSPAIIKEASRDAIAQFLGLAEAGKPTGASAGTSKTPPVVPVTVEAGVPSEVSAPALPSAPSVVVIERSERVDPKAFAALVRRVEAIDRRLVVHLAGCAVGADDAAAPPSGKSLEDADGRAAKSNGVRHIFSRATYRPLPEGVEWTDGDTAETQRRLELARYALKSLTEVRDAPARQRIVQALGQEIDELYRVIVALENLEPTEVFEMIDRERELSRARLVRR